MEVNDFAEIIEKIQDNDECILQIQENTQNAIWLVNGDTELRLLLLAELRLTVSRLGLLLRQFLINKMG